MRNVRVVVAFASAVVALTACAPAADMARPSESSIASAPMWTLEPIQITDSAIPRGSQADLLVPMRLFDDTAGGVWGVSGSFWLHLGAAGNVIAQFDRTVLDSPWVLTGVDAVTPTRIAAGAVWSDGNLFGDIIVTDTTTNAQTVVLHQEHPVGSIAVSGDSIVFISYAADQPSTFTVSRVDLATGARNDLTTLDGAGATAEVAVGGDGRIYVVSDVARVVMDADGRLRDTTDAPSANPHIAVNRSGDVVWVGSPTATATPFRIAGGSAQARAVIEQDTCRDDHVSVIHDGESSSLEVLCRAVGVAWLGEDHIVVSVGSEDGAPLIKITPPPDH